MVYKLSREVREQLVRNGGGENERQVTTISASSLTEVWPTVNINAVL